MPEIAVPRLPFLGAYAIRVASLREVEPLLQLHSMTSRRVGLALLVPFPPELGLGAWVFAEHPTDLPWRKQ
jgi:hypothetical protein